MIHESVVKAWQRLAGEVEDHPFATTCHLASGWHVFRRIVREHKCSRQLRVFALHHPELLCQRIEELVKTDFDQQYANPYDAAICAYSLALFDQSKITLANLRFILEDLKNCHWVGRMLSERCQ